MVSDITSPEGRSAFAAIYRDALLDDVLPFWIKHGLDREHGGFLTALGRDGRVIDTDKSIWFQGRGSWMFATLFNTVEKRAEWLTAAKSGIDFLRTHGRSPTGKLYFSVTREGRPLRMRRYAFSEAFAAIAHAAYYRATDEEQSRDDAMAYFRAYIGYALKPGGMAPKVDLDTRETMGVGPLMIGIATAQELRANLGDQSIDGRTMTEWIDAWIAQIQLFFLNTEEEALMEVVGAEGRVLDHFDGRLLNPGHALECAWFIMHEGKLRREPRLIQLGKLILDWMWKRGWDDEFGGILHYCDLRGLPIQEYWHDMKFWWPQCEAIIASLLAWQLTGEERYARWHQQIHDWSFRHFPDAQFGEWYGYLHRDGRISTMLKGNMWKGPFHLPRMLWYCWRALDSHSEREEQSI